MLRSKVFHALAGVFVVFISIRAGLLWWEHDRTLIEEQRRAENLAHVLSEHLERTFGAIESAVNQLAVHSERIGGPNGRAGNWSEVLDATLSGLSGIGSLNVLDSEGTVIQSTTADVTGTSRRGRYLHRRLKDEPGDGLVIGPAAPAEHVDGVRIPVGRALHDAEGRFIGFIAATFQPERLRGFYEAIDIGPNGAIRLFHRDGNLLFSQPHSAGGRGARFSAVPARGGADSGFVRGPLDDDRADYLTAWRKPPNSSLVVAVSIAEADAFAAWHTALVSFALTSAGMAVLLSLAGVWISASSRAHARTAAERDRVGEALNRNRIQFQAIIDNSPSGIFLKDFDGRYLIANRTVQEWYGLTAEDILGRTAAELLGDDGRAVAEQDRAVIETDRVVVGESMRTYRDGVTRHIVVTKFPVRFAGDERIGVGGILTDVTEAREAEFKLRQAQKMEAVGQLTGGVAHDFNNLLTAIIGNIDLLGERVADDPVALGYLDSALRAATRSSDLTQRLLAFSRRHPMDRVSTDVTGLVVDCRDLLRRTIGEGIDIDIYPAADIWRALVDPNQLENAILNLAINSRDAMTDGGKITIETSNIMLDEAYAARNPGVAPGPYVAVSVSDSGPGMPPEVLQRVFEPFFTTKPPGSGTGLGLSMVYGFARQSGGHVNIYSEVGQGTTVKIYLPSAASAVAERTSAAGPPADGATPRGSETILVAEDDPDVAAFAAAALESLGYRVLLAEDGQSALRQLAAAPHVDLLVTDVVLPHGMNGRQLMEKVRALAPGIGVLFISGYAESIIVHQGQLEKGVDFLAKPFAKDALGRRVRASLDARRQAAE